MSRLQRGFNRQAPLFVVIALVVTGAGLAYDYFGGVRLLTAAAFWAPLGLGAALLIALLRELGRNTVTSLSSLGRHRHYTVMGAAPELTSRALRQLPPDKRTPLGCLAFQPASPFATSFRDLQSTLTEDGVVAFTGAAIDEGATTSALCAAVSAAQQGRSVIIVDCDIRRRSLTRTFGRDPEVGVLELCDEPEAWRECLEEEDETGLHFLPAARLRNPWKSLVGSPGFPLLIASLRRTYDLVVLDCPPALGSAEGAIIAGMADKCILVATWDRTPVSAVRTAMRALRRRESARTGVYVNRVPPQYRFGRLRPD